MSIVYLNFSFANYQTINEWHTVKWLGKGIYIVIEIINHNRNDLNITKFYNSKFHCNLSMMRALAFEIGQIIILLGKQWTNEMSLYNELNEHPFVTESDSKSVIHQS